MTLQGKPNHKNQSGPTTGLLSPQDRKAVPVTGREHHLRADTQINDYFGGIIDVLTPNQVQTGFKTFAKAPSSSQKQKQKFKKSNPNQTYGPIISKKDSRSSKLHDSLTFVQSSTLSAATYNQQYNNSTNPKNYLNSGVTKTYLEKEIRRALN